MSPARAVHGLPRGRPGPLAERVVVVSPHLDDAVLSLGAVLSAHVRAGGRATVVTVFAGRPRSTAPAGEWDRWAGFAGEGAAAAGRRAEDRRACTRLGVGHRHLDAADEQYEQRLDDDELWRLLAPELDRSDEVLLPGFPLHNADHAAVTDLVLRRSAPGQRVRLHLEEPYALRERAPAPDPWQGRVRWGPLPTSAADVAAKVRAVGDYASQLPLLAPGRLAPPSRLGALVTRAQLAHAAHRRGEWVSPATTVAELGHRSR